MKPSTPFHEINLESVKKWQRRMNISAIILFLATLLIYLFAGLFLMAENGFPDMTQFFSYLNIACSAIAGLFLLVYGYMIYSLTWEMNFSRHAVLGWTILSFFSFSGADRSPTAFYVFIPFGALFTFIWMNIEAKDIIRKQTEDVPIGGSPSDRTA